MGACKVMSNLSLLPEERINLTSSVKSTDSLYSLASSKNSATSLYKKKMVRRHNGIINASSEVRQRVLSARLLRTKSIQNQLAEAQQQISELTNENKTLRTLHKRQDSALSKYQSTNAELPQLLHSHAEELRVWHAKYKNSQLQNRELANKLKQKDILILTLSDENRHLTQLNNDKNLIERERLSSRVKYLETRLAEKDNDIKHLTRRLQLEMKNLKAQLQNEQQKYKDVVMKLERAKIEYERYPQSHFDVGPKKVSILRNTKNTNLTKASQNDKNRASLISSVSTPIISKSKKKVIQFENSSGKSIDETETFDDENIKPKKKEKKTLLADVIKDGMSKYISGADFDLKSPLEGEKDANVDFSDNESPKQCDEEKKDEFDKKENESADISSSDSGSLLSYGKKLERKSSNEDLSQSEKEIMNDFFSKDTIMDRYCNEPLLEAHKRWEERHKISKEMPKMITRRKQIDPEEKSELLEALRSIDSSSDI